MGWTMGVGHASTSLAALDSRNLLALMAFAFRIRAFSLAGDDTCGPPDCLIYGCELVHAHVIATNAAILGHVKVYSCCIGAALS